MKFLLRWVGDGDSICKQKYLTNFFALIIAAQPSQPTKIQQAQYSIHMHSISGSIQAVLHINDTVLDVRIIDALQREIFSSNIKSFLF